MSVSLKIELEYMSTWWTVDFFLFAVCHVRDGFVNDELFHEKGGIDKSASCPREGRVAIFFKYSVSAEFIKVLDGSYSFFHLLPMLQKRKPQSFTRSCVPLTGARSRVSLVVIL